ncbi:MAG: MFS transporter, partial [Candidatus Omnitrophica bacterium]|nr:MFS transporter [Candidatus Omnitrophota bacterium]
GFVYGSFLAVYLNSAFNLSEFWIGIFFVTVNILTVVARVIESLYFKKIIKKKTIFFVSVITGLIYISMPLFKTVEFFASAMLFVSFLMYFIFPLSYTLFIKHLSRYNRGEVIGMNQTLSDAGGVSGNLIGGVLANMFGIPYAFLSVGVMYLIGAVASLGIEKSRWKMKKSR